MSFGKDRLSLTPNNRSLSLMTVLAMDYFRLTSIESEFALFQSLFDRIKSLLGFSESVAVNNHIICISLNFFESFPDFPSLDGLRPLFLIADR
jgi:hypothetical protein